MQNIINFSLKICFVFIFTLLKHFYVKQHLRVWKYSFSCLWCLVKALFVLYSWVSLYYDGLAELSFLKTFWNVLLNHEFVGIFMKFFCCPFVCILLWRRDHFNVKAIVMTWVLRWGIVGFGLERVFSNGIASKAWTHSKFYVVYKIIILIRNIKSFINFKDVLMVLIPIKLR